MQSGSSSDQTSEEAEIVIDCKHIEMDVGVRAEMSDELAQQHSLFVVRYHTV